MVKPRMRTSPRNAWISALGLLFLLPVAAADDCQDPTAPPTIPLDYYLLKDAEGDLALSSLPPSAAKAATWTTKLEASADATPLGSPESPAKSSITLAFPLPDYVIDEGKGIRGEIRASAVRTDGTLLPFPASWNDWQPALGIGLVEGERSNSLGFSYLYGSPQVVKLDGDYPGHEDADQCYMMSSCHGGSQKQGPTPHTHGAGDDADRPLFLSDVQVRLTFYVYPGLSIKLEDDATFEFRIEIDGRSFAHVEATVQGEPGAAATPVTVNVEPEPEEEAAADEDETGEDEGNETQTQSDDAREGAESVARVAEKFVDDLGAASTAAFGGLFAAAVGVLGWTRRLLRP